MSTFDLNTVIDSLGSSKIKTRNEVLNSLQKVPYVKLAHNPRQFLALSQALLRAIEIERDSSSGTLPAPVVSRVNNTSLILRELVEASLNLPAKQRPKFKGYFTILSTLMGLYFNALGEDTFGPCTADFAQIFDKLLKSEPFFCHLSSVSWTKCYKFVCRAITHEFNGPSLNDSLLRDLFSSLDSLMGSSSFTILPLVQSHTYFSLLPILKRAVENYTRRENPIILSAFHIINKLLVALSTEDFGFLHEVIHLGVTIILQFSSTSLDPLFMQFLLFLNHESFYRYFDISSYPKLVNADSSADSPIDSLAGDESSRSLYTLGMLIQALLVRSQTPSSKLASKDIEVCRSKGIIDWYHLRSVCHSSENTHPWLLLMAIPQLVSLYYNTRENKNSSSGSPNPESYRSWTDGAVANKRQKVKDFRAKFSTCSNTLQFLSSLMEESDSRLQTIGLQLIVFYFEWVSFNNIDLSSQIMPKQQTEESESDKVDSDHTSNFLALKPDCDRSDLGDLFPMLLRLLTEKNLSFWTLACFRSLFACLQISADSCRPLFTEQTHQLLKLLVPMVKDRALCHMSCSLFHDVISMQNRSGLQKLFDKGMLSQIQSILDLSDIAGPALLSDSGIEFWESLARVFENVSFPREGNLSFSVSRWIIGKWDDAFENTSLREKPSISTRKLAETLLWIGGLETSVPDTLETKLETPKRELFCFTNSEKLQRFITLEDQQAPFLAEDTVKVTKITGSNDSVDGVVKKMCESFRTILEDEISVPNTLAYAIYLMQIAEALLHEYLIYANDLQSKARSLTASLAPSISSKEQAASALLIILTYKPTQNLLGDLCFPFELIDYHFRYLASTHDRNSEFSGANELDVEFSQPSQCDSVKMDAPQMVKASRVEYFEFLLVYQGCPMEELSRMMQGFSSEETLACFEILVRMQETMSLEPSQSSLGHVIRLLGDGPLASHETDRSEVTIKLACRLVKRTYHFLGSENPQMETYCLDLINFFLQCLRKNLFISESLLVETWTLCLEYTQYNAEKVVSNADIRSLFLQSFDFFTNRMKLALSRVITTFIASRDLSTQMLFLQEICQHFSTPQSSVERSATFCFFMSLLTDHDTQICHQIMLILLEYSEFASFVPYFIQGIKLIADIHEKQNTRELFKEVRVDLIKTWLTTDLDLFEFPFRAFGYIDSSVFFLDNCRYIIAIISSLEAQFLNESRKKTLLDHLTKIKSCTVSELVKDCLPLTVALAYTSKGSRNKVFQTLSDLLRDSYEPSMKEKRLLIVLDIAKMTDVRSGPALGAALNNTSPEKAYMPKKVINMLNSSKISPVSSVDLTSALISKYSNEKEFWDVSTVYFIFRQLSLDLDTNDISQKIAVLRRLQFFWHISKIGFQDLHLVQLVMEIFSPLINAGFDDEISFLFNQLDLVCFKSVMVENILPSAITFLSQFSGQVHEIFTDFCSKLEKSLLEVCEEELKPAFRFLFSMRISGQKLPLTFEDVRVFLAHNSMRKSISRCYDAWVHLVSELFIYTYRPEKTSVIECNQMPRLVRLFLTHNVPIHNGDTRFPLWVSEYLADYYLSGPSLNSDIAKAELFTDQVSQNLKRTSMDFDSESTTINSFLKDLVDVYECGTNQTKAFVESVVGVFLWNLSDESSKFINWAGFENLFQPYIVALHPQSSDYLNERSPTSNGAKSCEKIADSLLRNECEFMLFLVHKIPGFTSMASIITSCVSRLPDLAVKTLPSFVLFFLHMAPKGKDTIRQYLEGQYSQKQYCSRKTELMTSIVLGIRIGAKRNIRPYKDLYESLDHNAIFYMVKESKSPESALMLFEDYTDNQIDKMDLSRYRDPLTEIYCALDEFDLISGMPYDVTFENSLKLLNADSSSAEAFEYDNSFMDASIALGEPFEARHMIQSLLGDGMLGLSKLLSETSYDSGESSHSTRESSHNISEWSWKLNQWQAPADENSTKKHDVIYSYFKQLQDAPIADLQSHEATLYNDTMTRLLNQRSDFLSKHMDVKCRKQKMQVWLETLAILRSVSMIFTSKAESFVSDSVSFEKSTSWFESEVSGRCEDVILARKLAFDICKKLAPENEYVFFGEVISEGIFSSKKDLCLLGQVNELSRFNGLFQKEGHHQKAINSSVLLEKLSKSVKFDDSKQQLQLKQFSAYQAAQTLWTSGKTSIPITMLTKLEETGTISLRFPRLSVHSQLIKAYLAKWKADSRMDLGINILQQIVHPMEASIGEIESISQRAQVYNLLARFCEQQYKSPVLEEQLRELTNRVQDRKTEIDDIKTYYSQNSVTSTEKKAVQKYYNRLKSQLTSETDELDRAKDTKLNFVSTSIKFYLEALLIDENDEYVDKFFSAFFELSTNDQLQESLNESLNQLSSYKSVTWCTQILSRASNDPTAFQQNVQDLIIKICLDHPFHALYPLLSLIFSEKMASETSNLEMLARATAAKNIRSSLQASSSEYATELLLPIEELCQQFISLAEMKSTRGKPLHLDKLKIGAYFMNELPNLPPPTLELSVSRNGYKHVPNMVSMEKEVKIAASGLSLPKIVKLKLSDGTEHRMLLKHGADDLRQDAIMEQVFEKVNRIFVKDKETRKRHLLIRTYRAVPLGPRAGVIQFVPNSKALIEVIWPYHTKMDNMKVEKAREMMKKNQSADSKQRLKIYQTIESSIKPVLRHYFAENFLTPDTWFHSRQLYTRGVATTSMVGHILGLGDRHCNNILLDEFTGEPIHIDLGVAFDQGKRLPIPEMVPFRLTRDIVDGFGFMGINGSFSRLCEHTLRVLRCNQEQILGILDVLRWDPLYSWSISPIRKKKLQEESPAHIKAEPRRDASEAESAILMVTEKLHAGGLSVEAIVRDLIREATSEQNLAVIYCGWYPFY